MGRKWIAKGRRWVIKGLKMDGMGSKRAVRGEGN